MSELRGLGAIHPQLKEMGVTLVAISVDPPSLAHGVAERLDLPFDILCDVDREVTDLYGLRHPGAAPDGSDVPLPAQVLVGKNAGVLWHYVAPRIVSRMDPQVLLETVRKYLVSSD